MAFVDVYRTSDLDRLKYDEIRERKSLFSRFYTPTATTVITLLSLAVANRANQLPFSAGIHRYFIAAPIAAWLGLKGDEMLRERAREKWAVYRHYIELHPEDFPEYPPRMKIADTLEPWIPYRGSV